MLRTYARKLALVLRIIILLINAVASLLLILLLIDAITTLLRSAIPLTFADDVALIIILLVRASGLYTSVELYENKVEGWIIPP